MAILPSDIWPIENPENFKVHFARRNGKAQPLDVWARGKSAWRGWAADEAVLEREGFWKGVLMTRDDQGFNRD